MQIEIKKAKIKNRIFLAYEYIQKDHDVENKNSTSSDAPIHDDLQNAFNELIPHLVLICEEEKLKNLELTDKLVTKYKVTGFAIAGSAENEGVVISGHKILESEKVVNFNTPFISFGDEDYAYIKELSQSVERIKDEVLEYMEGKQAPKPKQMSLFEEEEPAGAFEFEDNETSI